MPIPGYATFNDNGGTKVEGPVDRKDKEGTCEVVAMEHGVHLPLDPKTGEAKGNRVHSPFRLTKRIDQVSPVIFEYCCRGNTFKKITVDLYRTNAKGKEEHYFQYTLQDARVVSVEPVIPNTDSPANERLGHMETVSLGYSKITLTDKINNIERFDEYKI